MIRLIDEQGKLTPELEAEITQAVKMQQVEDLYRPYKQNDGQKQRLLKKRTWTTREVADAAYRWRGAIWSRKYIDKEKKSLLPKKRCTVLMRLLLNKSAIMQISTWIRSYTYNKGMYVSNVKDEQADEKAYMKCIMTLQNPSIKWFLIEY